MELQRLAAWLANRPRWHLAAALALLGFACVLPSLGTGLAALDDAQQRDFIVGHLNGNPQVAQRPWYDIYNLASGDQVIASWQRFNWLRPWWAWPGMKVRFFRPLAAATLYLDYALFGQHVWLAHLHSAFWYAAACFSLSWMALRLSQHRPTALLGALFFALDDAHASPASWLAGRNALIAATFVGFSMILYAGAAGRPRPGWAAGSVACLLLALLAAENVVSALPWFVSYAAFLDARPVRRRLGALGAMLAAVGCWLAVHHWLGFGTRGSGAYLDPIFDTASYLAALPERYGMLVHAQFAAPWDLLGSLPPWSLQAIDGLDSFLLVPALLVFVVRRAERDRELAFWSVSAVLGLLPLTAADPNARLLTHTGVAFWMVVAHFVVTLGRAYQRHAGLARALLASCIGFVIVVHAVLSPIALAKASGPAAPLPAGLAAPVLDRDPAWGYRALVFINVPSLLTPLLMFTERVQRKLTVPARMTALGATDHEVEITRLDARSFELYSPAGYLQDTFSSFWRGPSVPLRQGERIALQGFEVQVLRLTPDRRPLRMRVRFKEPLEDPALKLVYWDGHGFAVFHFAPVGQRRIIPAAYDRTGQLAEALVR